MQAHAYSALAVLLKRVRPDHELPYPFTRALGQEPAFLTCTNSRRGKGSSFPLRETET